MPAHKKAKSRKAAPARRKSSPVHPLHKQYFLEEQEAFFRKHTLAQPLLIVFMVMVAVFFVVVYATRYAH